MNNELAKKLKEAGFRRDGFETSLLDGEPLTDEELVNCIMLTELSELMEACERIEPFRYFCLEKHSNDWRAGFIDGEKFFISGPTKEEAVARLWLALKKR